MLGPVKHEDFPGDGLRCDEVGVLRHIPCAVDLARMIDLLCDLNARLCWDAVATQFTPLVIIICTVQSIRRPAVIPFRQLRSGYLKVVLSLARRVCTQK